MSTLKPFSESPSSMATGEIERSRYTLISSTPAPVSPLRGPGMGHLHKSKDILQASNLPVKLPNLDVRKTGKSEGGEQIPMEAGSNIRKNLRSVGLQVALEGRADRSMSDASSEISTDIESLSVTNDDEEKQALWQVFAARYTSTMPLIAAPALIDNTADTNLGVDGLASDEAIPSTVFNLSEDRYNVPVAMGLAKGSIHPKTPEHKSKVGAVPGKRKQQKQQDFSPTPPEWLSTEQKCDWSSRQHRKLSRPLHLFSSVRTHTTVLHTLFRVPKIVAEARFRSLSHRRDLES